MSHKEKRFETPKNVRQVLLWKLNYSKTFDLATPEYILDKKDPCVDLCLL